MKRRLIALSAVVALISVLAASAAVAKGPNHSFEVSLKGRNEVPAVDTHAQGQVLFKVDNDGDLRFKLIVANIDDVVASHIHCAPAGVNGPVGVTLFGAGPVTVNGILAQGEIAGPDGGNGCGWVDLDDVLAALASGDAYVNVHTLEHLPGEIRGQVK
jgi:hypothetical protein